MKRSFLRICILWLIASSMSSCQNNVLYEKNEPVQVSGWDMTDTLEYKIEVKDITKYYNLSVNVRHRDVFNFMNFYIKIITITPSKTVKEDVVSIPLADDGGTWLGKCSGDICFYRTTILKKFKFDEPGTYIFKINQEMRVESLENITDIGLRVEESPKKIYKEDEE